MNRQLSLSLGIVMVVAGVQAGPAWAQDAPNRAFRGLFGGNNRQPAADSRQSLDLSTEIQGGHDDNVLEATGAAQALDPRYQVGGDYATSNMSLSYATGTKGRLLSFAARAGGDIRVSPPELSALSDPRYDGGMTIGLNKTLGIMTVGLRQAASYSPFRVMTPFPRFVVDENVPVASMRDFAVSSYDVIGLTSDGQIGLQLGRRSSFNLAYRRSMTDYSGFSGQMLDQSGSGTLSYRLTRYASARVGYSYRLASYAGTAASDPVVNQNIDAGIDFSKPLSLSRKTSLTFTTGTSAASDGNRNTQYYAVGSAGIVQDLGKSWNARLMVNRSMNFLDGFATPYIQNGVTTNVGGYIGPRVDFVMTGSYADAKSTISFAPSRYETYTGAARLRVALSHFSSLYGQYFYYQYQFRGAVSEGLPPMMERRGFRGGLTIWLPLLR